MKKRSSILVACFVISIGLLNGCSANNLKEKNIPYIANKEEALLFVSEDDTKLANVTEESQTTDVAMVKLPEGIEGMKAETEAYPDLESLIIDYYDIPDDFLAGTFYYYNYVDLASSRLYLEFA